MPRRAARLGICMIALSLLFRLYETGVLDRWLEALGKSDIPAFLIYTQTGQDARSFILEETAAPDTEAAVFSYVYPAESPPPEILPPEFSPEDLEQLDIVYFTKVRPDLQSLLLRPAGFAGIPEIFIYHTHASESYTKSGEAYAESSPYRTENPEYNMVHIGAVLAQALEKAGLTVYHDQTLHDSPQYNGAYSRSRKTITAALEKHPGIQIALDIHRDAAQTAAGQLKTKAPAGCAQIMLVVGSSESGLKHPHWQDNLALALKLQVILERLSPGITRPLQLRSQRFNQDLLPGDLLIEIGAAGNTRREAEDAAGILARGLALLARAT